MIDKTGGSEKFVDYERQNYEIGDNCRVYVRYTVNASRGEAGMIQRETYMKRIRPFIDQDVIKVLTGVRRSGKSVMLELIKQELQNRGIDQGQLISFNFESMANADYLTADALYQELKTRIPAAGGRVYLFFDEIQEVDNWQRCINALRVDVDCDIYITGSNAKLLSGELATLLAGRYVAFVIYPFSFAEYLQAEQEQGAHCTPEQAFREYLERGGMPFLTQVHIDRTASLQYLRDVYNSVVLKDIVQRHAIRDTELLERVIAFAFANVGHTFSARSIANYIKSEGRKVAPDTVVAYLKYCCDSCLLQRVNREDVTGKGILAVQEKYYVVDQGFREAVYGSNARGIDQALENIVCIELLRRGYEVRVGKYDNREIDFIGHRDGQKLYIQVTYLLSTPEIIAREFDVLQALPDNYPKYVVSMDEFDFSRNGIKHRNLRDFLLMENWD